MCEVKTSDSFAYGTAKIITGISMYKYQMRNKKNWNKTLLDSDQESNKDSKMNLDINNENI